MENFIAGIRYSTTNIVLERSGTLQDCSLNVLDWFNFNNQTNKETKKVGKRKSIVPDRINFICFCFRCSPGKIRTGLFTTPGGF